MTLKLILGPTVTDSRGHGWNYRSLLTCDIGFDCRRSGAATWTKLQPLQVRRSIWASVPSMVS